MIAGNHYIRVISKGAEKMSNAAFDRLVWAQNLKNAKATLANMIAAEENGFGSGYTRRAIPLEQERVAYLEANRPL